MSSIEQLLAHWRSEVSIGSNIVHWQHIPARAASWNAMPETLHPSLAYALNELGYQELFSHQAKSWQHSQNGEHVVIVTGTASGKTLAYNLPVLDRLLKFPQSKALYLFPTKALAQDQMNELIQFNHYLKAEERLSLGTYDGDTPQNARPKIRDHAAIVFSNPDMLHAGILPHHARWAAFFQQLQFVVIDEIHSYRGVFGSHVANVIRRLKRVCHFYGSSPQFILTSATIANPIELSQHLIEKKVQLVNEDGSPRGEKHFLFYNPPILNEDLGIRKSVLQESVRLVDDLLDSNIQTILFTISRRSVEVMLNYLREIAHASADQIRGYRSGYLPRQRREIEKGLREGQVRAVVSTSALELGIDIGSMDAAVLAGYPGSISGTWQQAGRAGRKESASLSVLATSATPIDQFLAKHPEFFFDSSPEQALVNPNNLLILLGHLRCAAFEIPFHVGEGFGDLEGDKIKEFLDLLSEGNELHLSKDKYYWMSDSYPSQSISLRSASPQVIVLQAESESSVSVVGKIDAASADWMVHPEAVYMHEGQSYFVKSLNFEQQLAILQPASLDYFTRPIRESTVSLLKQNYQDEAKGANIAYGDLKITNKVTGYQKVEWYSHQNLGNGRVDLPERELVTTGYWLSLQDDLVESLREEGLWKNDPNAYGPQWEAIRQEIRARDDHRCQNCGKQESGPAHHVHHKVPFRAFASTAQANHAGNLITLCESCHHQAESVVKIRSGLSGLAYALWQLAPLFLMCDVTDLGMHADPQAKFAQGKPSIVIYDQAPAGLGLSKRLFELHQELVLRADQLVRGCICQDGCPACVGPGGEMGQGSKKETLAILRLMN